MRAAAPRPCAAGARRGRARACPAWIDGARRRVPVWHRDQLRALPVGRGPAVIADDGATLWVAPG